MVDRIEVTIPPFIADLNVEIPSDVAENLDSAARAIAALDCSHGPVLAALAGLLLRTESVASSKIEGISASIEDYARALHGSRANASAISMVAAGQATQGLVGALNPGSPITLHHLLQAHRTLMATEPGELQYAGRVRDIQNWVGGSDHSPRGALLIPPPPELLGALLADLMTFTARSDLPSLLQATIAHAQFETLHPFTDGNGRIGRALINAVLRVRGTTSVVVVPVASGLIAQRDAYFAALDAYRDGSLDEIVQLMARAAFIASEESRKTAALIQGLPDQWLDALGRTRRGSAPVLLLDYLLTHPVISAQDAEEVVGSGTSSMYAAIDRLHAAGIVRPLTERKRNQVWGAAALLDELDDLDVRIQARARG
jgi:Fic family protein